MLSILHDPAGVTGREQHEWDVSVSMQANIERHLSGGADCEVYINGVKVDPATDTGMDARPRPGDRVTIIRRPEGYGLLFWAYVVIAAYAIYTMATMPKPNGESAGKDSPNNKLTGQTNVARAYQAVPDVFGLRRVWPDLIQPSTVEYIDNLKYVTEWLSISRGKGTIEDVQYADTPIGDIDGSSYEVFQTVPVDGYPEFGSTTLNDVYEAFASDEVNGQELPYANEHHQWDQSGIVIASSGATTFTIQFVSSANTEDLKGAIPGGTARVVFTYGVTLDTFDQVCTVLSFFESGGNIAFTFSSSAWPVAVSETTPVTVDRTTPVTYTVVGPFTLPRDGDQIWWSTNFLRGLNADVSLRAEWWKIDGTGTEVPGTRQTLDYIYADRTFDQRFFTKKVTPTGGLGRYRIQFLRLNEIADSGGSDVAKLEEVYAVRHHPTKVLPGVTVLRVTTKATLSATGFSDRKFNLRWRRHVRTLTSNTLSASRNFARSIAHIWTVARNDMAGLDTGALTAINDQHGEDSPLLRFDGSLDDADMSLGERMQLIANMARCVIWRDGTKWTVTRDQARQFPEMQLDYRNLAAGADSTISFSSVLPATFDGVEVEYVDEATQAKKSYVRLNVSTGAVVVGQASNPKKFQLSGCTTLEQATNRSHLEARRLLYQRTGVSDTALSDALSLGIGSMVRWIDPNDFAGDDGLQAGEVMGIVDSWITTSEPLDWKGAGQGRILFTGEEGRHLGPPVVCTPAPAGVLLVSVPAGLYIAGGDRQLGSRYAFAVGLTEAEVESAGLYVVTDLKPAANGQVSLSLSAYDDRMYEYDT